MLEVSISISDGIPRISLEGRFDGLGSQLFEQEVQRCIDDENQWLVDFSRVVYLSSAGIRSLMKCGKTGQNSRQAYPGRTGPGCKIGAGNHRSITAF